MSTPNPTTAHRPELLPVGHIRGGVWCACWCVPGGIIPLMWVPRDSGQPRKEREP